MKTIKTLVLWYSGFAAAFPSAVLFNLYKGHEEREGKDVDYRNAKNGGRDSCP